MMIKHEYALIEMSTPESLAKEITNRLGEGWDLWGNTFGVEAEFDADIREIHFYQAMVRTQDDGTLHECPGFTLHVPETPTSNFDPHLATTGGMVTKAVRLPTLSDFLELGQGIGNTLVIKPASAYLEEA